MSLVPGLCRGLKSAGWRFLLGCALAACSGEGGGSAAIVGAGAAGSFGAGAPCSEDGRAFLDADGDGRAATDRDAIACPAGATAPAGYSGLLGDCDDNDPSLSTSYMADEDGDGFTPTAARVICGRPDEVPPGAVREFIGLDCDDQDPTRAVSGRIDADGDGFGAGPTECLGLVLPEGYAEDRFPDDCDDTRAEVHPGALELWSDNLDRDCDGFVDPSPMGSDFPAYPCGPLEIDGECSGADLVVVVVEDPDPCWASSGWWVTVGNRGTVSVPSFTLRFEDATGGEWVVEVADPLAPGVCQGYALESPSQPGMYDIAVSSDGDECLPDDNHAIGAVGVCL